MLRLICLFLILFTYGNSSALAQVSSGEFSNQEKCYLITFIELAGALRNELPVQALFGEKTGVSNSATFYDSLINRFFLRDSILRLSHRSSELLNAEGKIALVWQILNEMDFLLDSLPRDSIRVEAARHKPISGSDYEDEHTLNVFTKVGGRWVNGLACHFDDRTAKLIGFTVMLWPRM